MIEIRAPRYRDRVVLLARYRLPAGQGVDVKILHGAYKGVYHVSSMNITKTLWCWVRLRATLVLSLPML